MVGKGLLRFAQVAFRDQPFVICRCLVVVGTALRKRTAKTVIDKATGQEIVRD